MAIQRMEYGSTVGWQVRVGPHKAKLTRFFADRKFGGREATHGLAQRAERQLQRQLGPAAERAKLSTNRSGVVGVWPVFKPDAQGMPHIHIQASWSRGGRKCCTTFSTQANGLLTAVELAIQARERGQGKPVGMTPRQAWAAMRHLVGGREA